MKKVIRVLIPCLVGIWIQTMAQETSIPESIDNKAFDPSTLMWYTSPAKIWEEALPVGNGRLGAMVFGGFGEERIQLNEDTYWSGGPYSTVVEGGHKVLPEIQRHLFEGNPIEAHKLFGRHMMGYPVEQQKYQSLANLHLFFEDEVEATDYKRWLDLETGIAGVEYTINNVIYNREVFSSAPDNVILVRITANKPSSISFRAQLRGSRNQAHSNYATDYFRMDGLGNDGLELNGKSADYLGVEGRLRYKAQLKALQEGGKVWVEGTELFVEGADAVTLLFVAATNFVDYKDVSGDQEARVERYMGDLNGKTYDNLKAAVIKDHKALFDRVTLQLPLTQSAFLPTDERLSNIDSTPDPQMAALCYQFGRYLLISSSRPGTQPANLQGIWNDDMNPPWDSKYTTNINTQMNYWIAETGNLSESTEPLINMVRELTDQGAIVAKEHYGAGGWVHHQNTDIWRVAAPMDGPTWGTFSTGGAWLTSHLWEHYLFTLDRQYLKEVYPIMKGSVEFFLDFLVEHPDGRGLVTNPSTSPENPPDGPGYKYFFDEITGSYYFTTIAVGASIDMQILTDLFHNYLEASRILDMDKEFSEKVAVAQKRLVQPQIGNDGTLQEWADDFGQMEDKHRHFSHLYGLYPGNIFSWKETPEMMASIRAVLDQRGDGSTGWSRGWKIPLWARLYDGERANSIFKGYLKEQCFPSLFSICSGSLQVDGSLGVAAGISEMLIQSHEGVIVLLPAIPEEWKEGQFNGVCARGAFELNMQWKNGEITQVEILSKAGNVCRVHLGENTVEVTSSGKSVAIKKGKDGSIEFPTSSGTMYTILKK